jgi:cardiolipin synthase
MTTLDWGRIAEIAEVLTTIGYAVPIIMLFVIPSNRKPSSATAWLLLMLLLPYLGLLLYSLIGNPKLPARRQAQQRTATELITAAMAQARITTGEDYEANALLSPSAAER